MSSKFKKGVSKLIKFDLELSKSKEDDENLQFDLTKFKRRALNAETFTRQQKESLTTKPEARTEEKLLMISPLNHFV